MGPKSRVKSWTSNELTSFSADVNDIILMNTNQLQQQQQLLQKANAALLNLKRMSSFQNKTQKWNTLLLNIRNDILLKELYRSISLPLTLIQLSKVGMGIFLVSRHLPSLLCCDCVTIFTHFPFHRSNLLLSNSNIPSHQILLPLAPFRKLNWGGGHTRPLFVYFRPFRNISIQIQIVKGKHRCFSWDSNPGRQDGKQRRIHWAFAAIPFRKLLKLPKQWHLAKKYFGFENDHRYYMNVVDLKCIMSGL